MSIFGKVKDKIIYSFESIKNRYPCRIIKIKNLVDFDKSTLVTYQAVTRFNLRELKLESILDNPMLIEKFHPTDAVKLGFLSAAEILLKNDKTFDEMKLDYQKIVLGMFNDLDERHEA
jgi:hypothetical protein